MFKKRLLYCTAGKVHSLQHAPCCDHPEHGVHVDILGIHSLVERGGQLLASVNLKSEAYKIGLCNNEGQ